MSAKVTTYRTARASCDECEWNYPIGKVDGAVDLVTQYAEDHNASRHPRVKVETEEFE